MLSQNMSYDTPQDGIDLSICIPTYNRAQHLSASLKRIAKDIDALSQSAQVEIVISNNASTDNTADVITQFQDAHPNLHVCAVTQEENIGFDRNVLAVVDAANGMYCWLNSDDDKILPGGITRVLQLIQTHNQASVFVLNFSRYDQVAKRVTAKRMITLRSNSTDADVSEFFFKPTRYPSFFLSFGTNMITMSVDVFRREHWNSVVPEIQQFIGHNFIHIFVLATIMARHPQLYFEPQPQVMYLQDNERAWDNDIWKDYSSVYLSYLERLGYDKSGIARVRASRIYRRPWKERIIVRLSHIKQMLLNMSSL